MSRTQTADMDKIKVLRVVDSQVQLNGVLELLHELFCELVETFTYRIDSNLLLGCIHQLNSLNNINSLSEERKQQVLLDSRDVVSEVFHCVSQLPRLAEMRCLPFEPILGVIYRDVSEKNIIMDITHIHSTLLNSTTSYAQYTSLKGDLDQSVALTVARERPILTGVPVAVDTILLDETFAKFHAARKQRLNLYNRRIF